MDALTWRALIADRKIWIQHNFPGDKPVNSVLGVIEELGELAHAHLKAEQKIRGDQQQHADDAKDAVGDLTVFLLGVMYHSEEIPRSSEPMKVEELSDQVTTTRCILGISHHVGRIASKPVDVHDFSMVTYYLEAYCLRRGWDYEEIVLDTWAGVSQRNWIKYPTDGKTH